MNKQLVLFDFDGTLSKKDTFFQFILFSKGTVSVLFMLFRHSIHIFLYFIKVISAEELKRKVFYFLFKGLTRTELDQMGKLFAKHMIDADLFKKDILDKLEMHKKEGATIYVVSASIGVWIHPVCKDLGVKAICTEIKLENGIFNGEFVTKNCNGQEKANRIQDELNLKNYSNIIAYGNSKGDLQMFKLAHKSYLIN